MLKRLNRTFNISAKTVFAKKSEVKEEMKRWIHAASTRGQGAGQKLMDKRIDALRMMSTDSYQVVREALNKEMDDWEYSHLDMPRWNEEVPKEDRFIPSRDLKQLAKENGFKISKSSAKGILWRDAFGLSYI